MKILIFDVYGKFAHFRKFYTNSSSLTYSIPPKTTLIGMIASILGYERDSYYGVFGNDEVKISVQKLANTRKIMQTINYVRATSIKELVSLKSHTQIPFEILVGENEIRYRIYLSLKTREDIYEELKERLIRKKYFYPPYFGAAPFSCNISFVKEIEAEEKYFKDYLYIKSTIDLKTIEEIKITEIKGRLAREKVPVEFDKERKLKLTKTYLFSETGDIIIAKLNSKAIQIEDYYITFL